MVLLLLPTSANKLLAKWQGPYRVSKRMDNVDYLIETPNHRCKKGIYHVKLLKKWKTTDSFCAFAVKSLMKKFLTDYVTDLPQIVAMDFFYKA